MARAITNKSAKKKSASKPIAARKPMKAKKAIKKAVKKATPKKVAPKRTAKAVPVKKAQPQKTLKLKTQPAVKVAIKPNIKTAPPMPVSAELRVGSLAPSFVLPATLGGTVSSAELKGKSYVLYFYPKDDTSGCTAQACEFRNTLPKFSDLGVTVIGVSKDSMESHEKFSRKYNLTFPLASDQNSTVCESFGTWVQKSMYGRSYMGIERSTFLIDGEGVIRAIWRKVSVPGHIEEVRKTIESF